EVTSDFLLPALIDTFPRVVFRHLIDLVGTAGSFRTGEARLERLRPYFADLTPGEVKLLPENCVKSNQMISLLSFGPI
ncbi:MAG TPA: hypothetical protein VEU11_12250, partial [Terriglobales bacterium]|nr:hypothetical protein [Terriglobales bacterium]